MAEELFSGFDCQKILAERANKDINGNSLKKTYIKLNSQTLWVRKDRFRDNGQLYKL